MNEKILLVGLMILIHYHYFEKNYYYFKKTTNINKNREFLAFEKNFCFAYLKKNEFYCKIKNFVKWLKI